MTHASREGARAGGAARPSSGAGKPLVPGISPDVYSQADFDHIAAMVHREAGIVLSDRKHMLAYSRLAPLLRQTGCTAFHEFLALLDQDEALRTRTIGALTTNHTYFNREPHHFEHFEQTLRAQLIEKARQGEKVRIWSAGCSSGEEIWTLIMVLLGEDRAEGRRIMGNNILALASDLAQHALIKASNALYPQEAVASLADKLVTNWCELEEGQARIREDVRQMVRFRQLNLLRPWPFSNPFDVIFCRNVMIYFNGKDKEDLVLNLARQLKPSGYLYIGHSERVMGAANDLLEPVGPTIYQRKSS